MKCVFRPVRQVAAPGELCHLGFYGANIWPSVANLAEAASLAYGGDAVRKTTDFARVAVGGAEPAFDARPVDERHRTSALARAQELFDCR